MSLTGIELRNGITMPQIGYGLGANDHERLAALDKGLAGQLVPAPEIAR